MKEKQSNLSKADALIKAFIDHSTPEERVKMGLILSDLAAVSYTHLDVYKRQGLLGRVAGGFGVQDSDLGLLDMNVQLAHLDTDAHADGARGGQLTV